MNAHKHIKFVAAGFCLLLSSAANAQVITGPADVGRIKPEERMPEVPTVIQPQLPVEKPPSDDGMPVEIKSVKFVLKQVNIEGMTAFTQSEMEDIYKPYIDKEVPLSIMWEFADKITDRYRAKGYMLSRAFVPEQGIKNGAITIKVAEGYIGVVSIEGKQADGIVNSYIEELKSQKPVQNKNLESFLLKLNDLPGTTYRGVLTVLENDKQENSEAAVKLLLIPSKKPAQGSIAIDNYGSRFLGPTQATASYTRELIPGQETTLSVSKTLAQDELKYGAIRHSIPIAKDITLEIDASKTEAFPGYTLKPLEIESNSVFLSTSLGYQILRQREENLSVKFSLDGREVSTDTLGTALVRDNIRAIRSQLSYDFVDKWSGMNNIILNFSQGINAFGSSEEGELNLSRANAKPDFSKLELQIAHLQQLSKEWAIMGSVSTQVSSKALYSSEEFGYGGQSFGRAYDSSEITGDSGIDGSIEFQYGKWAYMKPVAFRPYVFYDAGLVQNRDRGQAEEMTGTSAGIGTRFTLPHNFTGNIGLAFPLTRKIENPIYGGRESGPRILLQLRNEF